MASRKLGTKARRYGGKHKTTNVFSQFEPAQIQEFKEAFDMIDQNRDGIINKDDLRDMLTSLGKNPTEEYLDRMLDEVPGTINFTLFLAMFGQKLQGTDPENSIKNAFSCFDEQITGCIDEDRFRELLTTFGADRLTDEQVDEIFSDVAPKEGFFDYMELVRTIKHGVVEPAGEPDVSEVTLTATNVTESPLVTLL